MGQLKTFMISMVVVSMIAAVFVIFLNSVSETKNIPFDNSTIDQFDDMTALNSISENMITETNKLDVDSGVLDIIGYVYNSALGVIKLTFGGVGILTKMITGFFENIGIGLYTGVFVAAFGLIITIVLIMTILSAYLKWGL